jgi:hypothetical protein
VVKVTGSLEFALTLNGVVRGTKVLMTALEVPARANARMGSLKLNISRLASTEWGIGETGETLDDGEIRESAPLFIPMQAINSALFSSCSQQHEPHLGRSC